MTMSTLPPIPSPIGPTAAAGYPIFSRVMFIIDLVLCVIRALLAALGILGVLALQQQNSDLVPLAIAEVITGLGIAVFGILGYTCLLMRQRWAVMFVYLTACATLASVIVGVLQLGKLTALQSDEAQQVGMYLGGGCVTVIRLGLAVMAVIAAVIYSRWAEEQDRRAWAG